MKYAKTDDQKFVRDLQSHALLNTDRAALERHRSERAARSSAKNLEQEVLRLKSEVRCLMEIVRQHIGST